MIVPSSSSLRGWAQTIAEFVGDERTLATVAALGVDYAQGFHLGKPAPVESLFGSSVGSSARSAKK